MPVHQLSVSVDLDPLAAYHQIHGLPAARGLPEAHLTRVALPRFLSLFEALGLRATFFVVGRDVEDPLVREGLAAAARAGHELANHTEGHPYGFLDLGSAARAAEIDACHDRLAARLGRPPVGFRAPGYHADAGLLALLAARGYRYDSSVLPSVPYYLAKAGAMAAMGLRGRRSGARLHPPLDLLAPRDPYTPDAKRPWRPGAMSLREIPAASLLGGVPLVGTFLGALPPWAARWVGRALGGRSFVTVELHGIDLVDAADGGIDALRQHQPGLASPWERRRAAFAALFGQLLTKASGIPLAEVVS